MEHPAFQVFAGTLLAGPEGMQWSGGEANDPRFLAGCVEGMQGTVMSEGSSIEREPFCVPEGWERSIFVRSARGGPSYRVLFYPNGDRRFEHRCDRGPRGVIICAPLLQSDHIQTQADPLTITPSILCPDCGTHGFITNGLWVDA